MIDKLKTILYILRETEKYLSGIVKYEWMKDHPHFEYNEKQVINDMINTLTQKQKELSKIIDELDELKGSK